MKKLVLISLLPLIFNLYSIKTGSTTDTPEMDFIIKCSNGKKMKNDNIIINMDFKNTSDKQARLLNVFDPLPVFFSINLLAQNGEEISPPGGGKISLDADSVNYIDLPPQASYDTVLNVSEALKKYDIILPAGTYKLNMSYHNQYGEDCFTGWFDSNQIEIDVTE
jgi:hypothetical protein